jgi:lipocalin
MNFKQIFLILSTLSTVYSQNFTDSLNLDAYLGKWYQVYSDNFVSQTFEKDASCVQTTYGLNAPNNISVYNQQTNKNGEIESISGYAFISDKSNPRKLTVNLKGGSGDAPYWIYDLGPIEDEKYQYSIVSDQFKVSLFVLVRNVDKFYEKYNDNVLQTLKDLGFDKNRNKPITTEQKKCFGY